MTLTKSQIQFLADEAGEAWPWHGDKDNQTFAKRTAAFADFGDYIVTLEKIKIETSFWQDDNDAPWECYGGGTWDDKDYENYFMQENLRDVEHQIKETKEAIETGCPMALLKKSDHGKLAGVVVLNRWSRFRDTIEQTYMKQGISRYMSDREKERALVILEEQKEDLERRLKAYLKRYGISKCRFQTYWGNR